MVESRTTLSKYAISNIFAFTDIKFSLYLRLVSRSFDTACLIGLNITAEFELVDQIDYCRYIISRDFGASALKEHQ